MIFDSRFEWDKPYRWRTNLRILLPALFGRFLKKGADCETLGAAHDWYNKDNETSACYHCQVERPGQLWHKDRRDAAIQPRAAIDPGP